MNRESPIHNQLKQTRLRLGLSQKLLAEAVGVTRQAIGAIESGQFSPSVHVALRIARTMGCWVEDLFWLDPSGPSLDARPPDQESIEAGTRVTLARVDERWIANPLNGDNAFRLETIPADGSARSGMTEKSAGRHVVVQLLDVCKQ